MQDTYRLISFNAYDAINTSEESNEKQKEFMVQMFGINEKGETASIFVEGFTPFFYVMVSDTWDESSKIGFINQMKRDMGRYFEESIVGSQFIKKNKLYGFDNNKQHTFIVIKFKNENAMKRAKGLWYINMPSQSGEYNKKLNPSGYIFNKCKTILYEAHILPLLRLFHIKEISPSGWIALPNSKTLKHKVHTTSCKYEYTIDFKNIVSLPKKETIVPYKICSFDIEASSSHGDFPLPVKNYKKLATNIVDLWEKSDKTYDYLKNVIMSAFNLCDNNITDVEFVYPKKEVTKEMINDLFLKWSSICPAIFKGSIEITPFDFCKELVHNENVQINNDDNDNGNEEGDSGDDSDGDGDNEIINPIYDIFKTQKVPTNYKKKGKIIDLLSDKEETRETKLLELTRTLTNTFPELKGDTVTFIGSTFLRYGEKNPYLNHCISLGTCDNVSNAEIQRCSSEKDVLLAWRDIIKREDPDIIIGYNIFGFDYQFMYLRAKELGCERSFLQLSRNNNEVCLNTNWRTGKEGLEENTLVIASGEHELKFVKMNGRLQIDLYNYFRRDFQLSQYKLDYVSGYFIGDTVKKIEYLENKTKLYSKNLTGLGCGNFINFEEEKESVDYYKNGKKFEVIEVNEKEEYFIINGIETPNINKKVKWGLAKDDVTPKDIFRMTNEGPSQRAIIAKYCIQDCNLVHHLMKKIDVMTGYIEMSSLCSVPIDFLVMRGQSIKLTSYIAKKCREKNTLMPVIDKGDSNEGYEGACVLEPKCNLYLDEPVACLDYASLYPSAMISDNISHDSKVSTKEYNLNGDLIVETGEKNEKGIYIYDNLPDFTYIDIEYNTYKWVRKNNNPKARMIKIKVGNKICRYAQYPNEEKAIMPSILNELLIARKTTKKLMEKEEDEFMKNILDKRQLSIKLTANSLYGQTGAKTSSFYEKDCAASTTAIGRKMLNYAKRVIEEAYCDEILETKHYGKVKVKAEYVYGDTDSVFFKFNLKDLNNVPIIGQKALEITIELAQQIEETATKFLKLPHKLEYEKTYFPFLLLRKKGYIGLLFELDPYKYIRKSMGIVLNRRDSAPIVKDIYGGMIDILIKDRSIERAIEFLKDCLQKVIDGHYNMDKFIITKALKSGYKKPNQIAHKVLADRIGLRDFGNKPSIGDRVQYVYIEHPNKKALQGERIETPEYIIEKKLKIDYSFYISNQIMKPIEQILSLVLENINEFKKKKGFTLRLWKKELADIHTMYPDIETRTKKENALRKKEVKSLVFDTYLRKTNNLKNGLTSITSFYKKV